MFGHVVFEICVHTEDSHVRHNISALPPDRSIDRFDPTLATGSCYFTSIFIDSSLLIVTDLLFFEKNNELTNQT